MRGCSSFAMSGEARAMPGPDYWSKPIRTSRDGSDYGNTRLGEPADPRRGTIRLTLLVVVLFVLALTLGSETVRAILTETPA